MGIGCLCQRALIFINKKMQIDAKKKEETKKALKWIVRSGVVTTFLSGVVVILLGLQNSEIDTRYAYYGFGILVLNAIINIIDYYQNQ